MAEKVSSKSGTPVPNIVLGSGKSVPLKLYQNNPLVIALSVGMPKTSGNS